MMPPPPSILVEDGKEFWRRYPLEFQSGFQGTAVLSALHRKMLKQRYFPVLGSIPKHFVGRNRRGLDMNVAQFENETHKTVDRTSWGLPVPNKEAAYISLAKYAKSVPALDARQALAMNGAVDWLHCHFGVHMQNSRVKTMDEVIKGLDMTTSPGFPWTRKYANKRAMYDSWKGFEQYMEDDWTRLIDDEYVAVFGNSLKEEIRLQEKIDANSLRTFTAGPVEMTIHGNRLFEDMNEKFYASHLQTASAVGFSPWKGGWNNLVRKLSKHPNGFALDESQYDSSLRAHLMWAVAEFRWSMLREEDRTPDNLARLRVYYRNLINTVIITSDGVFIMKQGGNPSGSVNTIVDNTLILYLLLAYGWQMVSPSEFRSYQAFEEHLALALVGDDNTWTVSDEAVSFFNARSLIVEWARIGVTTTTDCLDPRPVDELDFLSAFTVYVDGIAIPIYNRQKLLSSLLYSRSPGDPAYTLVRAAALLRVGWADVQIRCYLREFISWLVEMYGPVLRDSKEWKDALSSVPLESDLRKFYLGLEGVEFPLTMQGKARVTPEKAAVSFASGMKFPGIKSQFYNPMNQIGLPQRQGRRTLRRGNKRLPPLPPPKGAGYQRAVARMKARKPRRRSRRRRGGGKPQNRATGAYSNRGAPDGIRTGRGRTPFAQDEFITDFSGSTTFGGAGTNTPVITGTALQFPANPGQSVVFPWLSSLANRFEKYVFTKLEFYYKHEVSQFATAGTIGKVAMTFDYDSADSPPTNKQIMLDSDPHADGMPCEDILLRVDCREAFNNGPKYVRPGILPGGTDIKTYDAGILFIAGIGNASNTTAIGELHVRYAGYFEKPILSTNLSAPVNNQVSMFQDAISTVVTNGIAIVMPMLSVVGTQGLSIGNAAGVFTPQPGNYLVMMTANANDTLNTITNFSASIQKNGTSIINTLPDVSYATAVCSDAYLTQSAFVQMNGTDTITCRAVLAAATGTLSIGGTIVFLAV